MESLEENIRLFYEEGLVSMYKIDEYVNDIYREFDETDEDTKILIEETKCHLYDEVEDFKAKGFSEEESVKKAIYNFGKEKYVIKEMNCILKRQNKFSKIIMILALIMFLIAGACKIINFSYDLLGMEDKRIRQYENDKYYSEYILESIQEKLSNNNIDDNMKNEISKLLDDFNVKTNNGLYYIDIAKNNQYYYEYYKDIPKEAMELNHNGGATGNKDWTIYYNKTDLQNKYDSLILDKIMSKSIPYKLNELSNYVFILSWILVCISFFNRVYVKNLISKEYIVFFLISSLIVLTLFAIGKHTLRESMIFVIGFLLMISRYYDKSYLNRKIKRI